MPKPSRRKLDNEEIPSHSKSQNQRKPIVYDINSSNKSLEQLKIRGDTTPNGIFQKNTRVINLKRPSSSSGQMIEENTVTPAPKRQKITWP